MYIITLMLVLLTFLFYKVYIVPRKLFYFYLKTLQKMGYKVYHTPFSPWTIPFMPIIERDKKEGDALKFCKTIYRDNDVILTNSLHKIVLDFSHPDFIKDFYSADHLYTYPKLKFSTEPIIRAMGRGIPFSEGEEWKRKRKVINTVFNYEFIKSMIPTIQTICSKAIKQVEETVSVTQNENGEKVVEYDVIDLTVRMFSNVMLECFLGGSTVQTLQGKPVCLFMNKLISDVTQAAFEPLPLILGSKFVSAGIRKKDRQINKRISIFKEWGLDFIKKKIQAAKEKIQRSQGKDSQDIIQALLRSNKSLDEGEKYTEQQILEEFSTFFVAGTDTTSHYLMTMIYFIVKNPEVQKRLRDQIALHMKGQDYTYQNLKKLVYIDWIQKETSRMYGPITGVFMREAMADNYLNGLPIKKGTYLTIQHLGNHYSEKYFKQPQKFRPQRWEKQCSQLPPFVTGGFSAGPRTCIGKHLAMIESKIGLIKFMKRYKRVVIPEEPLKWVLKFVYSPEYFKSKMVLNDE